MRVTVAGNREGQEMPLLPESFRFLRIGWWITHLIAIPLVFVLGGLFWPR